MDISDEIESFVKLFSDDFSVDRSVIKITDPFKEKHIKLICPLWFIRVGHQAIRSNLDSETEDVDKSTVYNYLMATVFHKEAIEEEKQKFFNDPVNIGFAKAFAEAAKSGCHDKEEKIDEASFVNFEVSIGIWQALAQTPCGGPYLERRREFTIPGDEQIEIEFPYRYFRYLGDSVSTVYCSEDEERFANCRELLKQEWFPYDEWDSHYGYCNILYYLGVVMQDICDLYQPKRKQNWCGLNERS